MKKRMRCLYCRGIYRCYRRPQRCPLCRASFSLTVTKKTTKAQIEAAMAQSDALPITFWLAA